MTEAATACNQGGRHTYISPVGNGRHYTIDEFAQFGIELLENAKQVVMVVQYYIIG